MKIIKNTLIVFLAYLMAFSVILAGAHAKDVASHVTARSTVKVATTKAHLDDIAAKVASDLHNHIDKTSLKAFAKSVSDQAVIARQRDFKTIVNQYERSIGVALLEMMLLFRLSFAYATIR